MGFQGDPTAVVDQREAVLLDQGQHAADLPGAVLLAALLDQLAEHTDVLARVTGTPEQLLELRRGAWAAVLFVHPEPAGLGAQVLAQQLTRVRVEDAHVPVVPAHVHLA